jgi:hypothetical protein
VQFVILLLLIAALASLVVGLMVSSTAWIVASVVVSGLAVLVIKRARRRAEEAPTGRLSAARDEIRAPGAREEIAALAREVSASAAAATAAQAPEQPTSGAAPGTPSEEPLPVVAIEPTFRLNRVARVPRRPPRRLTAAQPPRHGARRGVTEVGVTDTEPGLTQTHHPDVTNTTYTAKPVDLVVSHPETDDELGGDEDPADEPAPAGTHAPLLERGHESVLVIDGRPRYHLSSCWFIAGRDTEPIPLEQAVEDGFSPCSRCDPDTALAAQAHG